MQTDFVLKLLLSFSVGAIWVALATTVADVRGTKLGGLVAGLPSTVVVTLLFVGIVQGPAAATVAAGTVPAAYSINGPFLILYCLLIRRGLVVALIGSLLPWVVFAFVLVHYGPPSFLTAVLIWLLTLILTYCLLEYGIDISSQAKGQNAPTRMQILFRGLMAGTVVSVGVLCSKLGGPVFGGVFASFPAVFLSALIISYWSGGAEFSRGLAKSMMLSGFINVVVYAIAGYFTFSLLGIWLGMVASLGASLLTGYGTLLVMRAKMS